MTRGRNCTSIDVVKVEGCMAVRETQEDFEDKGGLLVLLPSLDEVWIPKSQIHEDSEVYKKDTNGTLVVAKFIADKHEFTEQGTVVEVGP